MRKIKLGGFLGEKYGREHEFDVKSVREACLALKANYPEFEGDLVSYELGYHVFVDEENISENEVEFISAGDIYINPVVRGAGKFGQIIMGVVLIVASFIPGLNAVVAASLLSMGVGLVLSGVAQLFIKPPKAAKDSREDARKKSHAFSGAINTSTMGSPVPVLYGRMIVGSQVVSTNIRTISNEAELQPLNTGSSQSNVDKLMPIVKFLGGV